MQTKLDALSASIKSQESIVTRIEELLRQMILSGDLEPGERIVESRLSKQLGVGQPTVREALVALEHKGLVLRKTNQGAAVVSLSGEEIRQALRVREELEVLAVELAATEATDAELSELRGLSRAMAAAAYAKDTAKFFEHDLRWHALLWKAARNVFLEKMLEQLMSPLLAFLFLRNTRHYDEVDLCSSSERHLRMVDSMAGRDGKKARAVALEQFATFAAEHLAAIEGSASKRKTANL